MTRKITGMGTPSQPFACDQQPFMGMATAALVREFCTNAVEMSLSQNSPVFIEATFFGETQPRVFSIYAQGNYNNAELMLFTWEKLEELDTLGSHRLKDDFVDVIILRLPD